MLRRILQELQSSQGPVSLDELSRTLGVERSALEGMIAFWVRKGRLTDDYAAAIMDTCASDGCDASCSAALGCTLLKKLPQSFSLTSRDG